MSTIRPKQRRAILDSLRAGVVPRIGQQHIQVGRVRELEALLGDIDAIADGGAALRFIIGTYGSGKTFFLSLVHAVALERKLVATRADLSPERRLYARDGSARSLYAELMRNLSTRAKPDGGALPNIAERFIGEAARTAATRGVAVKTIIDARLTEITELTGGYDFAQVLGAYWRGHDDGDETLKSAALRWLRGEFSTRSDARKALGVRTIIDDANYYDMLKLMTRFVRAAGYRGLMVGLDEMVNLFKLTSTRTRNTNYEQLLRILNDTLQGHAEGLGFVFGGTPEFLMDPRRGLYSYEALASRLAENRFARDGLADYSGPVIRLANLSREDLYILLRNIRHVMANGDASHYLLPDAALKAFMAHCHERIGAAYFQTPRNAIKEFVNLLAILEQNPGQDWQRLIGAIAIDEECPQPVAPPAAPGASPDDELSHFTL